jgi:glycerophosphoryl diester phosphodiesterase
MEIIGHRGAAGLELENTISSILKAIELGVKWIEIDVWKTIDNEIIVFHDAYLDRLSSDSGFIKDFSDSELRNIKLLNGEHIPTLKEVVQICKEKEVGLLVELKDENALIPTLVILKSNLTNKEYIIGSFFHEPIKYVKEMDNNIQTSIMFECVPVNLSDYLTVINPDYITVSIESYNTYLLSTVKELNKKLIFYTINIKPEMELAKLAEPFGIITNYPNLFI